MSQQEENLCFAPRHAIHAVGDGVTVDLIICFQCQNYRMYISFDQKTKYLANKLRKHLMPFSPKVAFN
jgi:hypothetical protein